MTLLLLYLLIGLRFGYAVGQNTNWAGGILAGLFWLPFIAVRLLVGEYERPRKPYYGGYQK